jgi:hypothetical protein
VERLSVLEILLKAACQPRVVADITARQRLVSEHGGNLPESGKNAFSSAIRFDCVS